MLITPVVKNLILLNVVVFLAMLLFPQYIGIDQNSRVQMGLYYPATEGTLTVVADKFHVPLEEVKQLDRFQPYQIITYMFTHAGFGHIFFNMLGLWMFGTLVEMRFGPRNFLIFYIVCGLGAAALHFGLEAYRVHQYTAQLAATDDPALIESLKNSILMVLGSPLVGASGSIYGVIAAIGLLYSDHVFQLLFPPIPVKGKYMAIFYGVLELFYGTAGSGDNVAHFAHLGGMVTGVLLILFWRRRGTV